MRFETTNNYKKVSLAEGLDYIQNTKDSKLFSDGLEEDEYIYWDDNRGFCYEDDCVIGGTFDMALHRLLSTKWPQNHKFYVQINNNTQKENLYEQ